MAIAREDQTGIPLAIAAIQGGLGSLLDLGRRQILPRPQLGIGRSTQNGINLPIYVT